MRRTPPTAAPVRSLFLAAVAAVTVTVWALPGRSSGADGRPVLHKHVVIDTAASLPPGMTLLPGKGGPTDLPRAILAGGEVLPAPSLERPPGPIPTPGKNAWSVPDRDTEAEGELRYEEVFNPATAPYKRLAVFDRVGPRPDYTLMVSDPNVWPVGVHGPRVGSDRERFWGTVSLALTPGERADLPSVAAGMRILSYATEPAVELEFLRDQAENWYVEPRTASEPVVVRLVYLVDAPSFYFRGAIPSDLTLADVPESMRPASTIRTGARDRVLEAIGVTPSAGASYAGTVDALVAWFRSFEAGDSPRAKGSGGDLFLDLTLERTGVCRHRAFAFVATAHALGLPARYVANEAHAFVEMFVPAGAGFAGGWRRIDLGGAAAGLAVSGARSHAVHDAGPDPFPRPEEFARGTSRAGFDAVSGLRGSGARRADGPGTPGDSPSPGSPAGPRSGATSTGTEWDPDAPSLADLIPGMPSSDLETPGEPGAPGEPGPASPPDTREETVLELVVPHLTVLRGEALSVRGALTDAHGHALRDVTITFFLVGEGHAIAIGSTQTNHDGMYGADLVVPAAIEVGKYDLRARYAGDRLFRPTIAD